MRTIAPSTRTGEGMSYYLTLPVGALHAGRETAASPP
jgi:hypothetical protein